jgi:nitrite reductase (NADH) small subunit
MSIATDTMADMSAASGQHTRWTAVCKYAELLPGRGVAALLGTTQIAVFRTVGGELFALGNRDPACGAYVLSRGITGSRGGVPTVASPMYKHVYDLRTGVCLDDPTLAVPTYPVRRYRGLVWIEH